MKLFIINEIGFEYDDEYYRPMEGDAGKPVRAFKDRKNADAECREMNERARKEKAYESEGGPAKDYFKVVAVEVADDAVGYETARDRVKAAREEARKAAQAAFEAGAAELFATHEGLKSFAWEAYTPYFNDVDAYTFGVRNDEPDINGQDGDDLDSGRGRDEVTGKYAQLRDPSPEYLLQKSVSEFLQQFDDEDMLAMFGDHVKVTVARKRGGGVKVTTEEYEHG